MTYIIYFSIYCLALFLITYYSKQKSGGTDTGEYFVGSRKSGVFSIACSTVAGVVEPVTILFTFGLIFLFGVAGAGLYVAAFLTFFFMTFLVPSFYNKAKEVEAENISDFIGKTIGRNTEIIFGIVTLLFVLGAIIGAYSANLSIFKFFLGLGKYPATLIAFGITIAYTVVGGFRTVVRTDILQYIIMSVVFIVLCFTLKDANVATQINFSIDWFKGAFLMIAPVLFFQNLVKPERWQAVLGAKDVETAKSGVALGTFLILVLIVPIIYAAFLLKNIFSGTNPMEVIFSLVDSQFAIYKPIIFVAFMAVMMSSVDSALFYLGSTATKVFRLKNYFENFGEIKIAQAVILITSTIALLLSMFIDSFMNFLMSILPIIGIITLPFIGAMFFDLRKNDKQIAISMILGLLVFAYQFINPVTDYIWNILPVVSTFIIFLVIRK